MRRYVPLLTLLGGVACSREPQPATFDGAPMAVSQRATSPCA